MYLIIKAAHKDVTTTNKRPLFSSFNLRTSIDETRKIGVAAKKFTKFSETI
jgi:hypothetical protein